MIRIEPRTEFSRILTIGIPVLAALTALALAAIPIAFTGTSIIEGYGHMIRGVFGSLFSFTEMLTRATPLIFTGLAATIAFRARLWNIGAEGQLYLGALGAVIIGTGIIPIPAFLLLPMIILVGALFGAIGMLAPTLLKARFNADEVVTTLLLNFIILILVQMLLEGFLKDPFGLGWPQSAPILEHGMFATLIPKMRLHAGFILAIILVIVVHIALYYTVWGFKIRAVGENAAAARHAGLSVNWCLLSVAMASGACAGLAGVSEVAGLKGYLTADISPGFGYAGIVVAMLAGLSPLGVLISAIFIASTFVGADSMSRALGVSNYLADIVVSLSLICVLIGGFIARYKLIIVKKNASSHQGELNG